MDNTISINSRVNNSMKSLVFYWMAEFKNEVLFQFEDGKEHRFKEIIDRFAELEFFHLYHKEKDIRFIIDLRRGLIKYNNASEIESEEKKDNIRLIYFRRHKVEMSEHLIEKAHIIEYHLGIQWNDNLENNRQIVLVIDEQGNFIIKGD